MVYVVDDCRKVISCRSRNDDMLSACIDVSLSLSLGGIEACALQNYVNTDLAPRELSCVSLSIDLDVLAINSDEILACGDSVSLLISALCAVILEQVSEHSGRSKVVDRYDLKSLCAEHLTECQTANTSETINCYFYCHVSFLLK